MPIYEIDIPGRGTFEVESPTDLTDTQAYQAALTQARTEARSSVAAPRGGMFTGGNVGSAFFRGVRDPIDALAQMLPRALSAGASAIGAKDTAKFLSDEAKRVDALNLAVEERYQQERAARGDQGIDIGRVAGNIINPVNLTVAGAAPQLAVRGATALSTLPVVGRTAGGVASASATPMGQAVIGGATQGLAQPVFDTETKDYATELLKNVGIGAAAGGVAQKAISGVGRVLSPQTAPEVRALAEQGVKLTPGQILGGSYKKVEESFKSIPLVGSLVEGAERKSIESFNNAVINESLASIGQKVPKGKAGRSAITFADNAISNAYNKVLGKATVTADNQLIDDLAEITNRAMQELPEERSNQLVKIVTNKIGDKFRDRTINGGQWKKIDSDLGTTAAKYLSSSDADQRTLGSAIKEAQFSIRNLLERSNPQQADAIRNANEAFSKFLRVERAASSVGAKEGVFSPNQFLSATKAFDQSLRKGRFARGEAVMQETAEQGRNVLGANLPESGTANRLLTGGGVVGGLGYLEPTSLLLPLGIGAAYTAPSQAALRGLLMERPELLRSLGGQLRNRSPFISNVMTPGLLGE